MSLHLFNVPRHKPADERIKEGNIEGTVCCTAQLRGPRLPLKLHCRSPWRWSPPCNKDSFFTTVLHRRHGRMNLSSFGNYTHWLQTWWTTESGSDPLGIYVNVFKYIIWDWRPGRRGISEERDTVSGVTGGKGGEGSQEYQLYSSPERLWYVEQWGRGEQVRGN